VKKKRASAKNDSCNDPLRLRRIEDHLRKFVRFMEDPFLADHEKEEALDAWYIETLNFISEN
jgi:hypothetical protein